jgi:HEAT repeat protein
MKFMHMTKKRWYIFLGVLIVLSAVVFVPELYRYLRIEINIRSLKDRDPEVREEAAEMLGNFNGVSKPLGNLNRRTQKRVVALMEALKDPEWRIRSAAAYALLTIGKEGKEAVPSLILALKDPHRSVRWGACLTLSVIGKEAKEAVPALILALDDPDYEIPYVAVTALGNMGKEAQKAIPPLMSVQKRPSLNAGFRRHIGEAISKIREE